MGMLDLSGSGVDDASAQKLFDVLTRLQVASKRVMVAGNGLTWASITALSGYLWHSPEPLWELGLADNNITDRGVEELLRCLYNHPNHPPRLPASSSSSGAVFPLRLDVRNNMLEDQDSLIRRIESAGGQGSVQLCVTVGDGPAPTPVEANRPLPYLWVFLPRFGEQRKTQQHEEKREKDTNLRERDKEASKDKAKESKGDSKRPKDKAKHDKKEKGRDKEKDRDREKEEKRRGKGNEKRRGKRNEKRKKPKRKTRQKTRRPPRTRPKSRRATAKGLKTRQSTTRRRKGGIRKRTEIGRRRRKGKRNEK